MKVLLLSAYDAVSHQYWHRGLRQALPDVDWTLLTLPARYFSWRIRGNGLTWGVQERATLCREYDALVATSMVDLATLRGLVPALGRVPTLLYFHENQFAYPPSDQQRPSIEPQMVSLYASLSADALAFNSEFNRSSFLQGLDALLKKLPDGVPSGIIANLRDKSQVLPVPLMQGEPAEPRPKSPKFHIVWNHRWEYDKGPELLLAALAALDAGLPLTVHVVGQQFRSEPAAFSHIRELLSARGWLGQWGFIHDAKAYQALLSTSHLVLSTAKHDFQGLAVLEAVAAGCLPLVPKRLAYPEFIPEAYCYEQQGPEDVSQLCALLQTFCLAWQRQRLPPPLDLRQWGWPQWAGRYRSVIATLSAGAVEERPLQ